MEVHSRHHERRRVAEEERKREEGKGNIKGGRCGGCDGVDNTGDCS